METMKPLPPMKPMAPLDGAESWWPRELGSPASSGTQNGLRYAVFPNVQRLLIDRSGRIETFDTGAHRLNGVQQAGGNAGIIFSSADGAVTLDRLRRID